MSKWIILYTIILHPMLEVANQNGDSYEGEYVRVHSSTWTWEMVFNFNISCMYPPSQILKSIPKTKFYCLMLRIYNVFFDSLDPATFYRSSPIACDSPAEVRKGCAE